MLNFDIDDVFECSCCIINLPPQKRWKSDTIWFKSTPYGRAPMHSTRTYLTNELKYVPGEMQKWKWVFDIPDFD